MSRWIRSATPRWKRCMSGQVDAVVDLRRPTSRSSWRPRACRYSLLRVADYLPAGRQRPDHQRNHPARTTRPGAQHGRAPCCSGIAGYPCRSRTRPTTISKKYVENLAQADAAVQKQVLTTSIELWKSAETGLLRPESLGEYAVPSCSIWACSKTPLDLSKAYTNDVSAGLTPWTE